jgi:hypothetical protein
VKKIALLSVVCMFVFSGLVLIPSDANAQEELTFNFRNAPLKPLGHTTTFPIGDPADEVNLTVRAFSKLPDDGAVREEQIISESGNGLGVYTGDSTQHAIGTDGNALTEWLLFELPGPDWYFVSAEFQNVKKDRLIAGETRSLGPVKIAKYTPQQEDIIPGSDDIGPLGIAIDPAYIVDNGNVAEFMEYDNSANPGLLIGSYIWTTDGYNSSQSFWVASITIAKAPEPVTIESVIAFFDESVDSGAIIGENTFPCLANLKLFLMREVLLAAQWLHDEDHPEYACAVLQRAIWRADGENRPLPDFIMDGEGTSGTTVEFAGMLTKVRADLECE